MRLLRAALVMIPLLAPLGAGATTPDWPQQAAIAAGEMQGAARALSDARDAPDQLRQMAVAVQGYERALAAVREGIRVIELRSGETEAALQAERARHGRLLSVLQSISSAPVPVLMLHPEGPNGAARAARMTAAIVPALENSAQALRAQANLWAGLQAEQSEAEFLLRDGLIALQIARAELASALESRAPRPPQRDQETLERLRDDSQNLQAFARDFASFLGETSLTDPEPFEAAFGRLSLPVQGQLLRGFGAADAAGLIRPGMILEAAPASLVTAPHDATLRYAGPFLNHGQIAVLEPDQGVMLILAGLGRVDRQAGEVLRRGEPIGVLHGSLPSSETRASQAGFNTETIYVELRIDGAPVNPEGWFDFAPEGESR